MIADTYTVDSMLSSLPGRFRADKAGDWDSVFHFHISGAQSGQYTIRIARGICTVESGLIGEASCTVRTSDRLYLEIETGKTEPQVAFMTGDVEISNISEMLQFVRVFRRWDNLSCPCCTG